MHWYQELLDELDESVEWLSGLGQLSWRFVESENQLLLAPSVAEVVGGKDDGETVFPSYILHVSPIVELFTAPPEIAWDTSEGQLDIEGQYKEQDVLVSFRATPFDDEQPTATVQPDGGFRPA